MARSGSTDPTGGCAPSWSTRWSRDLPVDRIIFEAPRKDQQAWFVRRLGPSASLGNIPADEVVALETLRLGLRSDTLDLLPDSDGPGRPSEAFPIHPVHPLIH